MTSNWRRPLVTRRGLQIALGGIWLLDGALQFQSFMYSQGFLKEVIEPSAEMQPGWIGHPILSGAHFAGHDLALWNTLFALVQVGIGLGLLWRPAVRPALLVSFAWALVVWWFGEGFGMILAGMASPLTGAPGAVLLYGIVGLLVWPTGSDEAGRGTAAVGKGRAAGGGLIGERGGLVAWSALWVTATVLWCLSVNRAPAAIGEALGGAAGGSPHWLAHLQTSLDHTIGGHGEPIAIVLAILSLAIAVGVWTRWRRAALVAGVLLSLAYWVLGQSLGAINTGQATDPNAGPLFVLLALALMPRRRVADVRHSAAPARMGRALFSINYKTQKDMRSQHMSVKRTRWTALGALAAVGVLAASGCGGSSSAKTEASVTIKPMATWDNAGSGTTDTAMKGMSASAMKSMAKANGGMPYVASSAHGEAFLEQEGDHLTGWRRVWGLAPGSRHANHLHGPDGACSPTSKQVSNMAVVLPDLVANSRGEAYGTLNLIVHQRVVGAGYFIVVHQKPTPASQLNQIGSAPASMAFMQAMSNDPAILCGNVVVKS
jgi:hypothetical protein